MSDKKSFIVYNDWRNTFDKMPDEAAGKLVKALFAFANGDDVSDLDWSIAAPLEQYKSIIVRDAERWANQIEQRVLAGKKSAEARAAKSNGRSTVVQSRVRNPTVNVNVNVNDNKKDNTFSRQRLLDEFWDSYDKKVGKIAFEREWNKLSEDDMILAISKAKIYAKANEKKFRKDPERYIRNRSWEDEIVLKKEELKTKNLANNVLYAPNPYEGHNGLKTK